MPNLDQRVREPPQRSVLVERVAFELTAIGHVVADGDAWDRRKLAGLTFATVDDKIETTSVTPAHVVAKETPRERQLNLIFTFALLALVVGLWIYFR